MNCRSVKAELPKCKSRTRPSIRWRSPLTRPDPADRPVFPWLRHRLPDYYREAEWSREFTQQIAKNNMPNLTLLRLMHDHLGSFSTAIDGVNTPETEIADNDYAVGRVIDTVAHSPYASSTLIFVIEDDAQDGADHVDAHRSEAFIVGQYVKHHKIVSTHYSTVNFLRTMEDILGIDHLSIHDAYQKPMADVFDPAQTNWTYTATVPPRWVPPACRFLAGDADQRLA